MKKLFYFSSLFLALSCSKKDEKVDENALRNQEMQKLNEQTSSSAVSSPEDEGKILIESADCLACHQINEKMVGPSYKSVAQKYSEKDLDNLADKIINGGSGVWGDVPMAAHPNLSKDDAKKMVKYILSQK